MRVGLSVSSVGHAVLVGWAAFSFQGTAEDLTHQQPLPIDVISMEEYTQITAGARDGNAEVETQTPEPAEETPLADNPVPQARPTTEQSAAPEPEPPSPPEAAPEPEPEPEPVQTAAIPPEPEPVPEPAPRQEAAVEPEPAPMRTDAPMPRARPETPRPRRDPAPEPQRTPPRESERDFSPDRIAALLNRVPDSGGTVQSDARGDTMGLGMPTGSEERLSMSEIDALRRQIAQCWNPPVGVLEAGRLVVRIGLELNQDGSLSGPPHVLSSSSDPVFNVAAEAAMRAVNRCQPYSLPAEKYDVWRQIHVNFDPSELLGG
jgi:hypothetical protein